MLTIFLASLLVLVTSNVISGFQVSSDIYKGGHSRKGSWVWVENEADQVRSGLWKWHKYDTANDTKVGLSYVLGPAGYGGKWRWEETNQTQHWQWIGPDGKRWNWLHDPLGWWWNSVNDTYDGTWQWLDETNQWTFVEDTKSLRWKFDGHYWRSADNNSFEGGYHNKSWVIYPFRESWSETWRADDWNFSEDYFDDDQFDVDFYLNGDAGYDDFIYYGNHHNETSGSLEASSGEPSLVGWGDEPSFCRKSWWKRISPLCRGGHHKPTHIHVHPVIPPIQPVIHPVQPVLPNPILPLIPLINSFLPKPIEPIFKPIIPPTIRPIIIEPPKPIIIPTLKPIDDVEDKDAWAPGGYYLDKFGDTHNNMGDGEDGDSLSSRKSK